MMNVADRRLGSVKINFVEIRRTTALGELADKFAGKLTLKIK